MVRYVNKINKTLEEKAKVMAEDLNKKFEKQPKFFKNRKKKKNVQEDSSVPAPTTKVCPFCLSEINIKASRCPHCTSVLEEEIKSEIIDEQLEITDDL